MLSPNGDRNTENDTENTDEAGARNTGGKEL